MPLLTTLLALRLAMLPKLWAMPLAMRLATQRAPLRAARLAALLARLAILLRLWTTPLAMRLATQLAPTLAPLLETLLATLLARLWRPLLATL